MEIGIEVVTERTAALRFDEFPEQARAALRAAITEQTDKLRGMVEAAVPKRTGKLASEIQSRISEYPNGITGIVSVARDDPQNDKEKAAALEYGAHGVAHVRDTMMHLFGRPEEVLVKAHARKLNIKAHDYLRGPLKEISGAALAAMDAALNEATEA